MFSTCQSNISSLSFVKVAEAGTCSDWWLAALEAFDDDFVNEVRETVLSRFTRFEQSKSMLHSVTRWAL